MRWCSSSEVTASNASKLLRIFTFCSFPVCPKNREFNCRSIYGFDCIPLDWTCDRVADCDDNSDELLPECCESGETQCANFK